MATSSSRSICGTSTSIPNFASAGRGLSSTKTARNASASRASCWAIRAGSAASARSACGRAIVKPDTLKYAEGQEGRVRPARPHRRHGCRRDRRRLPLSEPRPVRRRRRGSRPRRRDVPRLQPLARRLLQAVSRPPVRGRDAADAVGRPRDRGDALRARRARDARRLPAAQPVSRQEDDQRPDVRAVLDDGRGARLLDRLSRGLDQRDADRRRRPLRGATARRAT